MLSSDWCLFFVVIDTKRNPIKINSDDADTPKEIGNEMFTTPAYYCEINDGSGWIKVPLDERVLPDFTTDLIKLDNVNITLTGVVDMMKFEGIYNSNLYFTGADTIVTLTDNIWTDGLSTVNVLEGATLSTGNDLCANAGMKSISVTGSAVKNSSFIGSFSDIETSINLDYATWTNAKRGTSINVGGKLTLSNTNWQNTVGGINLNTTDNVNNFTKEALIEIKDNNTVDITGNIRLGSSYATGGTATLLISGNNNSLTATNLEGPAEGRSGGDSALKVTGNNNTVFINGGNVNIDGYVAGGSITGGTQGVDISGEGNTFKATNRISIGRNDGPATYVDGASYLRVSSSNVENKAKLLLGNDVHLGLGDGETSTYTSELTIGGNAIVRALDGTSAAATINVGTGGPSQPTGGKAVFNVQGSNNDVLVTNINVMHINAANTAEGFFNIKGSNNKVVVNDSIRISSLAGSAESPITNGNGYLTVSGTGNSLNVNGFTVIGNHDNASAGLARFIVEGKNNTVTLNGVNLGGGTNITGGNGRFVVKGGGNNITVNGHFNCWSPDAASEDLALASGFEFIMDSSSISTIFLESTSGIGGAYYFVDLSNLVGIFEESLNGKFTLISSVNEFSFDGSKTSITLREGDEEGAAGLVYETDDNGNYVLNLYYTSSVPEPSTYAMIFGALALLFAMRKRAKRN